jgi:hypothetical protein
MKIAVEHPTFRGKAVGLVATAVPNVLTNQNASVDQFLIEGAGPSVAFLMRTN